MNSKLHSERLRQISADLQSNLAISERRDILAAAQAIEANAAEPEEPGDPDGECFRGGEYASALAEQQAQAKRLK